MPNCRLLKTDPSALANWKQQYLQQASAPLDGMWQSFVAGAEHYSISRADKVMGYCVVNADQKLLQFFADDRDHDSGFFCQVLLDLKVQDAVVSTCESRYLALCSEHSRTPPAVIALMYHVIPDLPIEPSTLPAGSAFRTMTANELEPAVEFAVAAIGADATWLSDYYAERIRGEELYGLWQADCLIATGECRPSQLQPPCADVGMVVAPNHRGRGIATNILRWLIHRCRERGLLAICSTESNNIAAQSAIENSGFVSYHQILEFSFGQESRNR